MQIGTQIQISIDHRKGGMVCKESNLGGGKDVHEEPEEDKVEASAFESSCREIFEDVSTNITQQRMQR